MDIAVLVLFAGLLIFAAHFFAWIFSFTNVPNVLLLMLVGIFLGPLTGLLQPEYFGEAGALFSTIVLAVILFEGGARLRWDTIVSSWRASLGLTVLNFALVVLGVGMVMWVFSDLGLFLSLLLGVIIGGPSSVIVIPIIDRLRVSPRTRTVMLLETAITDVVSIVLTIALLKASASGQFSAGGVALTVAASFSFSVLMGIGAALLWSLLLHRVRRMQNSVFSTPAFVFILFGLAELLTLSGPVAAFAFGVMMGNVVFFKLYLEQRHVVLHRILHPLTLSDIERSFFAEVVFLLETFFFVFVGLSLRFSDAGLVVWGLLLTLLMFALRIPAVRLAAPRSIPVSDTAILAVLSPIGLAAAVLAGLPAQYGLVGGVFIQEIVYVIIFFSVVICSVLLFLVSKTPLGRLYATLTGRQATTPDVAAPSFVRQGGRYT